MAAGARGLDAASAVAVAFGNGLDLVSGGTAALPVLSARDAAEFTEFHWVGIWSSRSGFGSDGQLAGPLGRAGFATARLAFARAVGRSDSRNNRDLRPCHLR